MNDDTKPLTVEDIMGEFGFRLVWEVSDYWASFTVYAITCRDEDGSPMFNRDEWQELPDPVESHEQAETYMKGFVKWDGCSELDQGRSYWCGARDFQKHCALLKHIYERSFQLMEKEPDKPWSNAVAKHQFFRMED